MKKKKTFFNLTYDHLQKKNQLGIWNAQVCLSLLLGVYEHFVNRWHFTTGGITHAIFDFWFLWNMKQM